MIEQHESEPWHGIPTFIWKGHKWIARPLWGEFHSGDFIFWRDKSLPYISKNGDLHLPVKWSPKLSEKDGKVRNFAMPFVRTVEEWKYGNFEWDVILPNGYHMWPALWFGSDTGWPPEIDALEGWSDENGSYVKRLIYKNIKPTMHWSANADEDHGTHLSEAKHNNLRCLIKPWPKVNTIKCTWTKSYVDIFYNGFKLKRFKNPEMLKHFNKEGYKMHAIMSNSGYGPWKNENKDIITPEMEMIVKDFRYYPLK